MTVAAPKSLEVRKTPVFNGTLVRVYRADEHVKTLWISRVGEVWDAEANAIYPDLAAALPGR